MNSVFKVSVVCTSSTVKELYIRAKDYAQAGVRAQKIVAKRQRQGYRYDRIASIGWHLDLVEM